MTTTLTRELLEVSGVTEGSAADFLNRRHEIEASYLGRS
jgi:hypothetical protein